jgi:phage regulator Rha-like protein
MFTSTLPSVIEPSFEGIKKLETGVAFRKAIERSREGKKDVAVIQGFIPFNAELFEPEGIFVDSTFIAELLHVEHYNLLSRINQEVNDFQLLMGNSPKILGKFKKAKRKTRRGYLDYYKVEATQALQLMATYATPVGSFMRWVLDAYIQALQEWYKAFATVDGKTRAQLRQEGKEKRRLLTDALKALGAQPKDYAAATNAGYKGAFGKNANELKQQIQKTLDLKSKNPEIREYASELNLALISSYENASAIALKEGKKSLSQASDVTYTAATIMRDAFAKFFNREINFEPTPTTKNIEAQKEEKKLP